ncbi:sensor histidine kinase [Alicyclobacillus fodiniaquatilis]|uniref:histidine kinase n=1 Tax=Alicyclobacillus fodiniaquatilis TaxID=1661150 RepID=A0ABW4JHD3_9BACL
MFRQVRLRLVLWNSIIFLSILICFGITVYGFTQYRLNQEVDESLSSVQHSMQHGHFEMMQDDPDHDHDNDADHDHGMNNDIVYILYDGDGDVIGCAPTNRALPPARTLPHFNPNSSRPYTLRIENVPYRVEEVSIPAGSFQKDGHDVRRIEALYNLQDQQHLLDSLRSIMEICVVLSIVIVSFAGLFLAGRALVPIQKSWRRQQQFVADASHELRTPLSVMQLHLERLLHHPDQTIEEESENISIALREAGRMRRLVGDLLTLARADSNQQQIVVTHVSIDEVIGDVASQFSYIAEAQNVTLTLNSDETVEIEADEERIRQLITIIMDNAIKYTGDNGRVEVTWSATGNQVHIIVTDTGIGIDKADLPHIFERFFRADKARSREQQGTGLGLSIAAWIVQQHHGRIQAESQPGQGTSIHIALPIKHSTR